MRAAAAAPPAASGHRPGWRLSDNAVAAEALRVVDGARDARARALDCLKPYPNVRKGTAFGSARTQPDRAEYAIARNCSRKIAQAG